MSPISDVRHDESGIDPASLQRETCIDYVLLPVGGMSTRRGSGIFGGYHPDTGVIEVWWDDGTTDGYHRERIKIVRAWIDPTGPENNAMPNTAKTRRDPDGRILHEGRGAAP